VNRSTFEVQQTDVVGLRDELNVTVEEFQPHAVRHIDRGFTQDVTHRMLRDRCLR
jgi:hypothetical protein